MTSGIEKIRPLIKWTGGKYDEYNEFKAYIPSFKRYYEPFFGGGGVFFALAPKGECYLNDVSADLIRFYTQIPNPRFTRELRRYVKAWEQSAILAHFLAKTLVPVVEGYIAGKVDDTRVEEAIKRTLATISYSAYAPLFETSFIINKQGYFGHVSHSLKDKCVRLKRIATREGSVNRDIILEQIETAVQAAFYVHVRSLHNHYAIKASPHN